MYPSRLEPRLVLDGAAAAGADLFLNLDDASGILTVGAGAQAGDGQADQFVVSYQGPHASGGHLVGVTVNGRPAQTFDTSEVRAIRIEGSADQDSLRLDAGVLQHVAVELDGTAVGGQNGVGSSSGEENGAGEDVGGTTAAVRDAVTLFSSNPSDWVASRVEFHSDGGDLQLTRQDGVVSSGLHFRGVIDVFDSLSVADRHATWRDASELTWQVQGETGWWSSEIGSLASHVVDTVDRVGESGFSTERSDTHVASWQIEATGAAVQIHDHLRTSQLTLDAGSTGTVELTGAIDASSMDADSHGGDVRLRAGDVRLLETAEIDVSGTTGGGLIEIGGRYRGIEDGRSRSEFTFIGSNVVLRADAIAQGDGGNIIVWSDDRTLMAGKISARGGTVSGDGGFVEVSGKEHIWMIGTVDTTATAGAMGTFLLDPSFIHIVEENNGNGDLDGELDRNNDFELLAAVPDSANNEVSTGQLEHFRDGAHVILEATGDITMEDLSGNLLDLDLGWDGSQRGSLTLRSLSGGVIFLGADDLVRTGGGSLVIEAATDVILNAEIRSARGDVTITSSGGQIQLNHANGINSNDGNLTLTAATSVELWGDLDASGPAGEGDVQIVGNVNFWADISIEGFDVSIVGATSGSDALALNAQNDITIGPLSSGNLTVSSTAGNITVGGDLNAESVNVTAAAGDVAFDDVWTDSGIDISGTNLVLTGSTLDVSTAGTINLVGSITLTADLSVSAPGDITFNGSVDSQGGAQSLSIDSLSGNAGLSGAIGVVEALNDITITGNTASLADVGTAATAGAVGTVHVTAGSLLLQGSVIRSGTRQTFDGDVTVASPTEALLLYAEGTSPLDGVWITGEINDSDGTPGDLTVRTFGAADILIDGSVGNSANLGTIQLEAVDGDVMTSGSVAADALIVTGSYVQFSGSVDLADTLTVTAQRDLTVQQNVSAAGAIDLRANQSDTAFSGFIQSSDTVIDTTAATAAALLIDVGDGGILQLASVVALGEVVLQSGGSIDGIADTGTDVIASALTINSVENTTLTTNVADLAATVSGTGDLSIQEFDGLNVTSINMTDGDVSLDASDLTIGEITTLGATAVTATSGAVANDANGSTTITASSLTIVAVTGIEVDSSTSNLDLTVSDPGNVQIVQTGTDLHLIGLALSSGSLEVTASQGVYIPNALANLTSLTVNAVDLVDFADAVDVAGSVQVTAGGNLTMAAITAGDSVTLNGDAVSLGSTASTTGGVAVTAQDGLLLSGTLDAGDGVINLAVNQDASGSEGLTQTSGTIESTSSALHAVTISAGGTGGTTGLSLTLSQGGASVSVGGGVTGDGTLVRDVAATSLHITAGTNVDLDIEVDELIVRSTSAGTIDLREYDAVDVTELSTVGGTITLEADGNVRLNDVDSGTGNISLTSTSGSLTAWYTGPPPQIVGNTLTLRGSSGIDLLTTVTSVDAEVTATGDLNLQESDGLTVHSLVANFGNVSTTAGSMLLGSVSASGTADLITTTGGIVDNNAAAVNIIASGLSVTSNGAVEFDTAVATLQLTTTATGDATVRELDALSLTSVNVSDGSFDVAAGSMTVGAVSASTTVSLTTLSGDVLDGNAGSVNVTSDLLLLQSAGHVTLDTSVGTVTGSVDGNLTVSEANGVTVESLGVTGPNTTISAQSFLIRSLTATGGHVDLQSDGVILGEAGGATDLTAQSVVLRASDTVDLTTAIDSLDAVISGAGNLTVRDDDSLTVVEASTAGVAVDLNASSLIIQTVASVGNVNLTARTGGVTDGNAASWNITTDSLVVSSVGAVDLDTVVASIDITVSVAGDIHITEADSLTVDRTSTVSGNVNVTATQIIAGSIVATGQIELTATSGGIGRDGGVPVNVTGGTLVTASIGGVTLHTQVDNLQSSISGAGNLLIQETDAIDVALVSVASGNITLNNTTGLVDVQSLTAVGGSLVMAADDVRFNQTIDQVQSVDADLTGDLTLTAGIAVVGPVNIDAAGNVVGDGSVAIDLTVNQLTINAGAGIDLDIDVDTLSAAVTGAGHLDLREADAITVTAMSTADGDLSFLAGGDIQLGAIDGRGGQVDVETTAGTIASIGGQRVAGGTVSLLAVGGIDVNTDADQLDANVSGTGTIEISELDAVTLQSVSTFSGGLTVIAGSLQVNTLSIAGAVQLTTTAGGISDNNGGSLNVAATSLDVHSIGEVQLDTDVGSITGAVTGSGDLVIRESGDLQVDMIAVADGGAEFVGDTLYVGGIQASQTVTLRNLVGSVVDTNGATVNVTAGGLDLQVAGDAVLQTTVASLGGNVGGLLTIVETDALTIDGLSLSGGDVNLTAHSFLFRSMTGAGDSNLQSTAAVLGEAGGTVDLAGQSLTVVAGGEIDLTTEVAWVDAEVSGTGDLSIADQSSLIVVRAVTGSGDIALAGSDLTLNTLVETDGTVQLTATTGGVVNSNGSAIDVIANRLVIQSQDSVDFQIDVNFLQVSLLGPGHLSLTEVGSLNVESVQVVDGNVSLQATQFVIEEISASGQVDLLATTGGIARNSSASPNITAASLALASTAGINLHTDVGSVTVTISGPGNVQLSEVDDLDVLQIQLAGGDAFLSAGAGTMLIQTINLGNGSLDVQAANVQFDGPIDPLGSLSVDASGDVGVDASITASGAIVIDAGGQVTDDSTGATDLTATSLDVTGVTGIDLDVDVPLLAARVTGVGAFNLSVVGATDVSELMSGGGAIDLSTGGNLRLRTVDSSGGDVTLTSAGGSVTAWTGPPAPLVSGGVLSVSASTGIDLQTNVSTLVASSALGDIRIVEQDALTIDSVQASSGAVDLRAGDILIGSIQSSGLTTLTTTAGGLADDNGAATNVVASGLQLSTAGGFDLDTDVGSVSATTTSAGDVSLNESGVLEVQPWNVFNGDVSIVADRIDLHSVTTPGAVTLHSLSGGIVDFNALSLNVTAASLDLQGAGGVDMDTSVTQLAGNFAGGATIANSGNLTITTLDVSGGSTVVSAQDLTVDSLIGTHVIQLQATGTILRLDGIGTDIIGPELTLQSGGNIDLVTSVDSLEANITSGNLQISDSDAISVDQVTVGGDVTVSADTIGLGQIVATGTVSLSARTGGIVDENGSLINVTADRLIVDTQTDIRFDSAVNEIIIDVATDGDVTIENATASQVSVHISGTGNVDVTADQLTIGQIDVDGMVVLVATNGSITRDAGYATNVFATELLTQSTDAVTLHTDVDQLQSSITGTADLAIQEADDLIVGSLGLNGGSATIVSQTGSVSVGSVTAPGGILHVEGLHVQLGTAIAQLASLLIDADGDVLIQAMAEVTGLVQINAGGNVTGDGSDSIEFLASEVDVTAASDIDLDVYADTLSAEVVGSGTLTVDATGPVNIESLVNQNGSILLTGTDDIQIRQLDAGSESATIFTSGGSVSSWLGGVPPLVRAGTLVVTSLTGVDLITDVDDLTGGVTGAGSMTIQEQDDLSIDSVTVDSGGLDVHAAGHLAVGVVSASTTVTLEAEGGSIVDANGSATNVQAAHLSMTSRDDAALHTQVDTLDATITNAGVLDIVEADGLLIRTIGMTSGDAFVVADDLQLDTVTVAGNVRLETRIGDLIDAGSTLLNVAANTLEVQVAGRLDLDTAVGELTGQVLGTAVIEEQDGILVQQLDIGGSSSSFSAGDLQVEGVTAAGSLTMLSESRILGVAGGSVDVTTDTLQLQAVDDINLTTEVSSVEAVSSGGGMIQLDETDVLLIQNVSSNGGSVTIAADDLQLNQITAATQVQLTARDGSVSDGNGSSVNVTANWVQISSAYFVELDTDTDLLTVNVLQGGDIVVRDVGDVVINSAVTPAGGIDITASEMTVIHASASEAVTLHATAGVILGGVRAGENVSAASLSATAVDGIDLSTSVSDLTADVSGAGDVVIREADDLSISSVTLSGGNLEVTSAAGSLELWDITADNALLTLDALDIHFRGSVSSLSGLAVQAAGDVQWWVPLVVAGDASIDAVGDVTGDGSDATDLTAVRLDLAAGGNVNLDVELDILNASTTGPGDITISAVDDVDVESLSTQDGAIQLTAGGNLRVLDIDAGIRDLSLTSTTGSIVGWVDAGTPRVRGHAGNFQAATGIDIDTDLTIVIAAVDGVGSLAIRDEGTVDVQHLAVTGGNADVSSGGSITIQDISVNGELRLTSGGSVTGSAGPDADIVAFGLIVEAQGDVDLRTNVDGLWVEAPISGDIHIVEEQFLRADRLETGQGDIRVEVESGDFIVSGPVLAGDGEIEFSATTGDVIFFNEIPLTTNLVQSLGPNAAITAYAGRNVYVDGPGNVLFQTPDSQYLDTRPNLIVVPLEVPGFPDVHVHLDGSTEIEISFGLPIGPSEQFFRLVVDWGDAVEVFDEADVGSNRLPLQRGSAAAGEEYVYLLTHKYLTNPTGNSAAPIPITLHATQTTGGGTPSAIEFFAAGDPTTPLSTLVQMELRVPSSGLAVSVSTPEFASIPTKPLEVVREFVVEATPSISVDGARTIDTPMTVTEAPTTYERYYVLRIVVLVDEDGTTRELDDIRIDDRYVRNLPELFELLPDDRYRLYQIREDGIAQMVTDVLIQGGQSAGVKELEDEGSTLTHAEDRTDTPSSADQAESTSGEVNASRPMMPGRSNFGRATWSMDEGHRVVPRPHWRHGRSSAVEIPAPRSAEASIAANPEASPLPSSWQWRASGRLD